MGNNKTTIGATFWVIADQAQAFKWADSLQQRLKSDGTDVELISVGDVIDDIGMSEFAPEAWIRVICHLVVRLQKHGVAPIVTWSDATPDLLGSAEGELEKQAFFVGSDHSLSYSGARIVEEDESFVDVALEVADQRELFNEAISDQRSDEEVTDRLKNLGYI